MVNDGKATADMTAQAADDEDLPTVENLLKMRTAALKAIGACIAAVEELQTGGDDPVDKALEKLRDKRSEIEDLITDAIAASPGLAAAILAMKKAAKTLNDTAAIMTGVTEVLKKIDEILGFGNEVVSALKSVGAA